jgi:gamma-glutamylcyclotransferase (GGCT)/AIG2-like uncharacterized protein YtfP
MPEHLFVYGTLRRGFASPVAECLQRHAIFRGMGRMPGRLFLLGTLTCGSIPYPGATFEPGRPGAVVGEIHELPDPAAVFAILDPYEGIGPQFPQPQEYVRRVVTVEPAEGGPALPCWCYIINRPTDGLRLIPSGDFANR